MGVEIDLTGSRALITGAGQGVGQTIAGWFAAAGAEVLVNDFVPERAEAVAAEIRAEGGSAIPAPFDVTARTSALKRLPWHTGQRSMTSARNCISTVS